MGQMKWIYTMVQDGSYQIFKGMYESALKTNAKTFKFGNRDFSIAKARHICILGDRAQLEYDKYIDSIADAEYDAIYLEQ